MSWGPGTWGRGGGTSQFGGVFGCQCDGFHVLLPSQVTEPKATQHQCCSLRRELSEPVRAEPFTEHRQPVHMAGLFVYAHTCL